MPTVEIKDLRTGKILKQLPFNDPNHADDYLIDVCSDFGQSVSEDDLIKGKKRIGKNLLISIK